MLARFHSLLAPMAIPLQSDPHLALIVGEVSKEGYALRSKEIP